MTLTLDLELDVLKMYLHTRHEVSSSRLSEVRVRTGQTDTTERIIAPHSQWAEYMFQVLPAVS